MNVTDVIAVPTSPLTETALAVITASSRVIEILYVFVAAPVSSGVTTTSTALAVPTAARSTRPLISPLVTADPATVIEAPAWFASGRIRTFVIVSATFTE